MTIDAAAYENPYAWLEQDSEETLAWQAAQNAAALEDIRSWSGFERLEAAVAEYAGDSGLAAPQRAGDTWFQLRAGTQLLAAGDAAGSDARVLVDADVDADASGRGPASLDWQYPSPDGSRVAYGISYAGDEQSVLQVVETASGRVLEDRIPFCSNATVAWLPDSSGFAYNAGLAPDLEHADKHLFLHRIGQAERSEPEPLQVRESYCVFPQISPDGRYLAAVTSEMDPRPDYICELPEREWRVFLEGMEGYNFGFFHRDSYVCVSTLGAPNGRLVRIPIATARAVGTWVELVPESDEVVLKTVERAGDQFVLTQLRDAYAEVRVLDRDGGLVADVELPGRGAVLKQVDGFYQEPYPASGGNVHAAPGEFAFVFASLTRSPATYRYDIDARRLEELQAPRQIRDDLIVEDLEATAPDGTLVRHRLIRRRDVAPAAPQPTLIHGYGGWNASFLPSWMGVYSPFVDAGGVFVLAHLRGGGEFGARFWEDGRLERKQHTFDDTYAIAESLIAQGRTTPERLGLLGKSNGGLGTGVALTQRPELFGAIASLVPLYDMLRFDRDSYTASCTLEYGDPRDPEAARWLHAYSPVHNVREAAYPATLIMCGANDMRCRPWHARKLAAAIQAANRGDRPVLFRATEDGGHLSVTSFAAEWLGFLMRELGLTP